MFNQVILIGNVGRDPEIRKTDMGEFATFSLATSEKWKDRRTGQTKEITQWHTVAVFNEQAVNYIKDNVKKGSKLQVVGQVTYRQWQDQSGNKRTSTDIKVDNFNGKITNLSERSYPDGNRQNDYDNNPNLGAQVANGSAKVDLDDEIPF